MQVKTVKYKDKTETQDIIFSNDDSIKFKRLFYYYISVYSL